LVSLFQYLHVYKNCCKALLCFTIAVIESIIINSAWLFCIFIFPWPICFNNKGFKVNCMLYLILWTYITSEEFEYSNFFVFFRFSSHFRIDRSKNACLPINTYLLCRVLRRENTDLFSFNFRPRAKWKDFYADCNLHIFWLLPS
jgi:hypothetical protein